MGSEAVVEEPVAEVDKKRQYPSKPRFEGTEGGPIAEVGFARVEAEPPPPAPPEEPAPIIAVEPVAVVPVEQKKPPDPLPAPLEIDYSGFKPREYHKVEPNVNLRSVQADAVEAFFEETTSGGLKRAVIALPTGCGKTVAGMAIAGRVNGRVLWIAHRDELIEQPAEEIDKRFPGLEYGVEKGNVRTGVGKRIVIASIQTLAKLNRLKPIMSGAPFSLVIYDECHHATSRMAQRTLALLGCLRTDKKPGPLLLGLTATIERSDKTSLGEVFEDVIYSVSMQRAIELGYLVPPKPIKVYLPINPKALKIVNGDFAIGDLERELARTNAAQATATAILANCGQRKTVVFCASVDQAKRTAAACADLGLKAAWVSGEPHMNKTDRRAKLHQFSIGEVQVITCADLLTEGYDERSIGAVVVARPTKSQGRYVQMAGRGLRTCEHKVDCLLIDLVSASDLGLATAEILIQPEKKKELKKRKKADPTPDSGIEWQKLAAYLRSASVDLIEHGELTFARASSDMIVTVAKDRELVILRRVATDPDLWQIEHRGITFTTTPLSLQEVMTVCDTLIDEFGGGAKPGSEEWDVATSAPAPPKGFNPTESATAETTTIVQPEARLPIAFARTADEIAVTQGMTPEELAERIDNDMLNSEAAAFTKGVKMALIERRIHLVDFDKGPPYEPHRWGWIPSKRPLIFNNDIPFESEGALAGMVRGEVALIDAELCVPLAKEFLMSIGEPCDIRITHLRRHLGTKKTILKGEKYLLKLNARDIDPLVGDPDARKKKAEFIVACRNIVKQAKKWKPSDAALLYTDRALGLSEQQHSDQPQDDEPASS